MSEYERVRQCVDNADVLAHLTDEELDARIETEANAPHVPELAEFLAADDVPHDWLVPGLLERGDRLILTGPEGGGKSTLLRQLGVQLSSGVHPFAATTIDPIRVLLLDLENSVKQVRRQLRPLYLAAGDRYKPQPGMAVLVRPQGLDVLEAEDATWLREVVSLVQPELLITGPTYKLAGGDPTEERTARTVVAHLDRIRADHGCGLILEAHSPYASGGARRPERPYGASLWSRWPEFGLYLSHEGQLRHWRGARDERDWPAVLQRGGEWPWTPVPRGRDTAWVRITEICRDAGEHLSERDLAKLLGVSQSTVHRAIAEHRPEWEALAAPEAS